MSKAKTIFARLYPQDKRQGRFVGNVHFEGQLYRGGDRPTWYKVPADLADRMGNQFNPGSGAPMFQVVDEKTKNDLSATEQQLRLVALGVASETVISPGTPAAVDLTAKGKDGKGGRKGRASAVPKPAPEEAAPAAAPAEAPAAVVAPAGVGDLSSADLTNQE